LRAIAIVLLLTFPAQALAQFNYKFQALPPGEKCVASDHWCYTLPEFKLLIEGDSELVTLRAQTKLLGEKLEIRADLLVNYQKQIGIILDSFAVLQGENQRLTKKWAAADKALQEALHEGTLWPWIVLGVGGAALLAAVGIIVGVYASGGGK
jgi:hypothetical protein